MAEKGLPAQGSDAILKAFSDANEEMLKNGRKQREKDNEELREVFKGKGKHSK